MQEKVGEIEGYDVIYIPEKNQIFCKNTAINFSLIEKLVRSSSLRETVPEKKLTIVKDQGIVTLGCLTTSMSNCLEIRKKVNKLKNK